MPTRFLWDDRLGRNLERIAAHGMAPDLWEEVYAHATRHAADKDDPTIMIAEGRARDQRYRIVYAVDDDVIIPLTILPITGFPITRRGLR